MPQGMVGQGMCFALVGSALVLVDSSTFVILTALGLKAILANVSGRVVGALLGFWLNGQATFRGSEGARLGKARFVRYVLLWTGLTLLSTTLIVWLSRHLDLHIVWLTKLFIEAGMALLSFLLSRGWVYR